MEIIKNNATPTVEIKCRYCGSELRIGNDDIFFEQYPIDSPRFRCPCCHTINRFRSYEDRRFAYSIKNRSGWDGIYRYENGEPITYDD